MKEHPVHCQARPPFPITHSCRSELQPLRAAPHFILRAVTWPREHGQVCCILNACPGTVFDNTHGYVIRNTNKRSTHATVSNVTYSHTVCPTTLSHLLTHVTQEPQKLAAGTETKLDARAMLVRIPSGTGRQELLRGVLGVLFSGHLRIIPR